MSLDAVSGTTLLYMSIHSQVTYNLAIITCLPAVGLTPVFINRLSTKMNEGVTSYCYIGTKKTMRMSIVTYKNILISIQ